MARLYLYQNRSGFTLIELLMVVAIVGIIAAVVIPGVRRAHISANESTTIASLRSINNAQTSYAYVCGRGGYAVRFPTLALAPPGGIIGFLSPDLSGSEMPVKSQYVYTITAGAGGGAGPDDCNHTPTNTRYYVSAVPQTPGLTGTRGFATTQDRTIWQDVSGAAPAEPLAASGTVSSLP